MPRPWRALLVLSVLALGGWATDEVPLPRGLDPQGIEDEECALHLVPDEALGTGPRGRAIGDLSPEACHAALREARVPFHALPSSDAPAVAAPVLLDGALGGIVVRASGGHDESIHSIIDCRLAVALVRWAPALRAAGVTAIEHVSIFRPGARVRGSGRPSGHSHALAIDAFAMIMRDGTRFSILDDWAPRDHGRDPCIADDLSRDDNAARVRAALCTAVQEDIFQVVLTPHHDPAHANHLHLEVRPGVAWSFVR